ncbi:MAG: DNA mismatch repair protein MutS, partial [Pseudomonadota bacterium]
MKPQRTLLDQALRVDTATPMIRQYLAIKRHHGDVLLFYRMGDFYELFFDDAIAAAKTLDINLTQRGMHGDEKIPMCGVPYHAHENYLTRLIKAGFHVAICEQTEDPVQSRKSGGNKNVINREVIRIITPGTLSETNLLQADSNNFLASIARSNDSFAIAWVDISTGQFRYQLVGSQGISGVLASINASEILLSDHLHGNSDLENQWAFFAETLHILPKSRFDTTNAVHRLHEYYQISD